MTAPSTSPPVRAPAPADGVANRHKLMMLIATGARMAVGLATFIVMARYLGPASFGIIATAFAYATFAGIATDYGLAVSTIRLAAAEPEEAASITSAALATKSALLIAVSLIAVPVMLIFLPPDHIPVYILIFAGTLAFSFGDLSMVAARAKRRFGTEALTVVGSSIVMLTLVGATAALTENIYSTATAFMIGRFGYLAATLLILNKKLGIKLSLHASRATVRATLRHSSSYALDSLLTTLANQLDILMFSLILSAHEIGIYQAGARLAQVIVPFSTVLATVYMPTLSAAVIHNRHEVFRRNASRMTWEFSGLAVIGSLIFCYVGPFITPILYGSHYEALRPLWAGLGLFVMLRFSAAAFGIQLTAIGRIRWRIGSQLTSMAFFAFATYIILPEWRLPSTSWLLAFSALPSFLILGLGLLLSERDRSSWAVRLAVLILPLLGALFVLGILWSKN